MATLEQIARIRYLAGAPADPASDAIWVSRIAAGTHTLAEATQRITVERGNKFEADRRAMLEQQKKNDDLQREQLGDFADIIMGPGGGGGSGSGGGSTPSGPPPVDFAKLAAAMYPWLPASLLEEFKAGYVESAGNETVALNRMRQSPTYKVHFAGNLREDGSVRYSEAEYNRQIEGYERVFGYYDIPSDLVRHMFARGIEGGVDAEALRQRLDKAYLEVMSQSEQIRAAYADQNGLTSITDSALLLSFIDPGQSPAEIQVAIARAHVGGAALESGFNIDLAEATRLQQAGLGLDAARSFYRNAQGLMPTLGQLVGRHNDPDDEFDLSELTDALIFSDPSQTRRMRQLFSAEGSLFTGSGGVARSGSGMTGLTQR